MTDKINDNLPKDTPGQAKINPSGDNLADMLRGIRKPSERDKDAMEQEPMQEPIRPVKRENSPEKLKDMSDLRSLAKKGTGKTDE